MRRLIVGVFVILVWAAAVPGVRVAAQGAAAIRLIIDVDFGPTTFGATRFETGNSLLVKTFEGIPVGTAKVISFLNDPAMPSARARRLDLITGFGQASTIGTNHNVSASSPQQQAIGNQLWTADQRSGAWAVSYVVKLFDAGGEIGSFSVSTRASPARLSTSQRWRAPSSWRSRPSTSRAARVHSQRAWTSTTTEVALLAGAGHQARRFKVAECLLHSHLRGFQRRTDTGIGLRQNHAGHGDHCALRDLPTG